VFLIWTGVLILGPVLSLVAAKIIGAPIARAFKVTGKMAHATHRETPSEQHAGGTSAHRVALVTAVALLASTLKAQVREIFGEQFVGDFVVKPTTSRGSVVSAPTGRPDQRAPEVAGGLHRRQAGR
jgi:hypothetical protein